jgi:hypothetical protein
MQFKNVQWYCVIYIWIKKKKDQYISKFNDIIKALVNNYIAHAVLIAYEYSITTTFHGVCFEQFQLNIIGKKIIDLA